MSKKRIRNESIEIICKMNESIYKKCFKAAELSKGKISVNLGNLNFSLL